MLVRMTSQNFDRSARRNAGPLRRRGAAAAAVAVALSLSLAACGGSDKPTESPKSQATANGSELTALWPLTGLPVKGEVPNHPIAVVKIDNTSSSQPQMGLGKADLITEELVEGGITRLAVFYHSQIPQLVGPVRSMRASDIGVVKPAQAILVASGAAGQTIGRLNTSGVKFREGGTGYFRESSRRAPYNLMARLPQVLSTFPKTPNAAGPYLPWGAEKDFTGTGAANTIAASFSRGHTTNWRFEGGKYTNQNSNAAADGRFVPDSVLVLRVQQGDAGYLDPAGNPVPETIYKGTGNALLFHKGQVIRGTWTKPQLDSALTLKTASGELKVPAGKVWIELVPTDAAGGRVSFG